MPRSDGRPSIPPSSRTDGELVAHWAGYATRLSRAWFHPTIAPEDWRQEALIATWDAVQGYDPAGGGTFKGWLAFVVRRHLTSVLKEATREKRRGNVEAVRTVTFEGETVEAVTLAEQPNADPLELLETRDEVRRILRGFKSLSPLEQRAIRERLNGVPQDKSTDNACYRARQKLRRPA